MHVHMYVYLTSVIGFHQIMVAALKFFLSGEADHDSDDDFSSESEVIRLDVAATLSHIGKDVVTYVRVQSISICTFVHTCIDPP